MAFILNIETSNTNCSVSLSEKGKEIDFIELNEGFSHAENLHVFIETLLKKNNIKAQQLSAVALSAGPGSYTGLRIGASAAKGLCYALNIPLISIGTLEIMTRAVMNLPINTDYFLPMIDARRMEVYCALYDRKLNAVIEPFALIVDDQSIVPLLSKGTTCVFGDGMPKCKELILKHGNFSFSDNIIASSRYMHEAAYEKFKKEIFEDVAYFEPNYIKAYMFAQKIK